MIFACLFTHFKTQLDDFGALSKIALFLARAVKRWHAVTRSNVIVVSHLSSQSSCELKSYSNTYLPSLSDTATYFDRIRQITSR